MAKDSKDEKSDTKKWPSSVTDPIPREKLPADLQKIVDRQDDWMDEIYDGQYDAPTCSHTLRLDTKAEAPTRWTPTIDMPHMRTGCERSC
jgi:hypothetical protein